MTLTKGIYDYGLTRFRGFCQRIALGKIFFEIALKPNKLTIRSEILYGNIIDKALYDHYIIE